MRTWTILLLAVLVLLLSACGTPDEGTNGGNSEGGNEGEMAATLEKSDIGYRYTLKNGTKEAMTFNFTSSQRFDFALYNENDEQVFLHSSVSSYAQVLGEETAPADGELSYELEVPPLDLKPGTYKIEAWFTPQQGPAYPAENEYKVE